MLKLQHGDVVYAHLTDDIASSLWDFSNKVCK